MIRSRRDYVVNLVEGDPCFTSSREEGTSAVGNPILLLIFAESESIEDSVELVLLFSGNKSNCRSHVDCCWKRGILKMKVHLAYIHMPRSYLVISNSSECMLGFTSLQVKSSMVCLQSRLISRLTSRPWIASSRSDHVPLHST